LALRPTWSPGRRAGRLQALARRAGVGRPLVAAGFALLPNWVFVPVLSSLHAGFRSTGARGSPERTGSPFTVLGAAKGGAAFRGLDRHDERAVEAVAAGAERRRFWIGMRTRVMGLGGGGILLGAALVPCCWAFEKLSGLNGRKGMGSAAGPGLYRLHSCALGVADAGPTPPHDRPAGISRRDTDNSSLRRGGIFLFILGGVLPAGPGPSRLSVKVILFSKGLRGPPFLVVPRGPAWAAPPIIWGRRRRRRGDAGPALGRGALLGAAVAAPCLA